MINKRKIIITRQFSRDLQEELFFININLEKTQNYRKIFLSEIYTNIIDISHFSNSKLASFTSLKYNVFTNFLNLESRDKSIIFIINNNSVNILRLMDKINQ